MTGVQTCALPIYSNSFGLYGATISGTVTSFSSGANPSIIPVVIRGAASQTANLQEWQDSSGYTSVYVRPDGYLYSNYGMGTSGAFNAGTWIGGIQLSSNISSASTIGLVVRGAGSQTANLTEWQDSTGTVLSRIGAGGELVEIGRAHV